MKLQAMIFVTDLGRARQFYAGVLGFDLRSEGARHLTFSCGNFELAAFLCDKAGHVGDYANEARSVLVFEVDSVERVMKDWKSRGVPFLHDEPARNDWGQYVAFVDPFGIVHELFSR
jgi:catechol 2,3-dioxygenase-like lactoylglutathione lyase family enzyme